MYFASKKQSGVFKSFVYTKGDQYVITGNDIHWVTPSEIVDPPRLLDHQAEVANTKHR